MGLEERDRRSPLGACAREGVMDLTSTVYSPPRAKAPWRLEDLYTPATVRHYAYGRQALTEALRLAGAAGKTVLLPAFICREVLSAVAAAGVRPAFYAVAPDLTPEEPPGALARRPCRARGRLFRLAAGSYSL